MLAGACLRRAGPSIVWDSCVVQVPSSNAGVLVYCKSRGSYCQVTWPSCRKTQAGILE